MTEIKRNRDGSFNLHSVLKHENLNRIQEQLKEFEDETKYVLVKKVMDIGYISRSENIIVTRLENGNIEVAIPSFKGTKWHEKRTYKKL